MGLGEDHSEPVSPKGAAAAAASGESRAPSKRLKPWPQLREAVQTAIATANSHTEMMQDMLLNLSKEGSDDYDFQRGFLNDLVGVNLVPTTLIQHGLVSSGASSSTKGRCQLLSDDLRGWGSCLLSKGR